MEHKETLDKTVRNEVTLVATEGAMSMLADRDYPSDIASEVVYICDTEYVVVPQGEPISAWIPFIKGAYMQFTGLELDVRVPHILQGLRNGYLGFKIIYGYIRDAG